MCSVILAVNVEAAALFWQSILFQIPVLLQF
jgi:hypothetical protein